MSGGSPPTRLDAASVQALALAQGHEWVDAAVAERIAAGAGAAVAAVVTTLAEAGWDPFDVDPDSFVTVLESLADGE